MLDRLLWLGHDAFLVDDAPVIYVDPFRLEDGSPGADLILITHGHFDHCSPVDIEKIATDDTLVVAPPDCAASVRELGGRHRLVQAGTRLELLGVEIEVVPAYTRRSRLHGRANGWVGYVISSGDERWYHAGDTDYIVEMRDIQADVACVPVSGRTVMNPAEAAAAAGCIDAGITLPMHYGSFMGSREDAERFRELAAVRVELLEPGAALS